jgi:hypothetical protein
MNSPITLRSRFVHLACAVLSLLFLTDTSVWAAKTEKLSAALASDETAFVFAGKCETDEPYRLVSYQKNVSGVPQSFYDYEGPNGKGTVRAETAPKVMAARVCRKMAEIINANYWE